MLLVSPEASRENLRHRSCCGHQQDRGRHRYYVLPAKSERALNKFLTEYDWDEDHLNRERLELLQTENETRWSSDGVVVIDDIFTHKTGKQIPNAGKFYDHSTRGYIWGQNLVYAIYADKKTTYPLFFRLYEKDSKTRVELATELVDECIEIGVPRRLSGEDG